MLFYSSRSLGAIVIRFISMIGYIQVSQFSLACNASDISLQLALSISSLAIN